MKVLLTQDVYGLGHAGEVKNVADGYGRNFLLPRGMAVLATASAVKRADAFKSSALKKRASEQADVDAVAQVIGGTTFSFAARAGEKGKLYGSITSTQIAEAIGAKLGKEFDKRKVALREPIREVGTYTVPIRLGADSNPTVTVVVMSEGAAARQSEAASQPAESEAVAAVDAVPEAAPAA